MQGISYGRPEPFSIPDYDYGRVQAIARATNLGKYYDNILSDAFERSEEDYTYGIPAPVTKRLLERAANGFEWPAWSKKLNDMGDHYRLKISGLPDEGDFSVHFVHKPSKTPNAIPLLLVHGWPGRSLSRSMAQHKG